MTDITPEDDDWDINKARAKLRPKGKKTSPKTDNSKAAHKRRKQELSDAVDRRSLRATGRTEQFNFKVQPELKKRAQAAANAAGMPIALWMENTVLAALAEAEGDSPPDA